MQEIFDLLTELWNSGNVELVSQVYTEDSIRSDSTHQEAMRGRQQIADYIKEIHAGFPDFKLEIVRRISGEDQVATEWTCSGTHNGVFQGIPPTGRRVTIFGASLDRIQDGKIAEEHAYYDRVGLLQQLGVIPMSTQIENKSAAHS